MGKLFPVHPFVTRWSNFSQGQKGEQENSVPLMSKSSWFRIMFTRPPNKIFGHLKLLESFYCMQAIVKLSHKLTKIRLEVNSNEKGKVPLVIEHMFLFEKSLCKAYIKTADKANITVDSIIDHNQKSHFILDTTCNKKFTFFHSPSLIFNLNTR